MRFSIFLLGTLALLWTGCSKSDSGAIQASGGPAASSSAVAANANAASATVGKPPEIDTTAVELLDAYLADAKAASKRYKGKFVLVFGAASEFGKDEAGNAFVILPKSVDDPAKDAPKLKCMLKAGQDAAVSARKAGDKVDVAGTVDEVDGAFVLRDCVLDTQLKICQLSHKSLGKGGKCEPLPDKLGVRWSNGTDGVEMACQSPPAFNAWVKDWTARLKDDTARSKISVEKTACRALIEPVNIRLGVDLTVTFTHIAWIDNVPTLMP